MILPINHQTHLALLNPHHTEELFQLIENNRIYLREWLMFIDATKSVEDVRAHCTESMELNRSGAEYAFVIIHNKRIIGRIGLYKLDLKNKISDIAYWIDQQHQGKGLMYEACKTLIHFAFNELKLNRIEIRCSVDNQRSIALPKRLNFTYEGTMRQSKRMSNEFKDVKLFSLLRTDYERITEENRHVQNGTQ
ncbi:MAG: GNAT family N-acetyltransferase [Chitinophagaceae bacterium]|nr:GNAT family N-acetyltransferase [Chitinophagaceae bacterium]